ncbi:MAG: tetratricopeptide repeat protein [Steroidobacteraceae bacterium]
MSKSVARILGFSLALCLPSAAVLAHGGGSMGGPSLGSGMPMEEASPESLAKSEYNAGLRSVKKAKEYESDATSASTPEKQARAREKAQKAFGKALEQFHAAVGHAPNLVEAWNYIGFSNRHLGAYAESLEAYDKALTLNPRYFEAMEYRAEAYLGLNRIDEAKSAYMDLFRDARPLSDELLGVMQSWVAARRQDAKGLEPAQLDAFEQWVGERTGIAKQTASLAVGAPAVSWR